jgi:hypothetical protein
MSRHSSYLRTVQHALVALFMVLVVPACWYGASAPGQPSRASASSSEEEHRDHEAEASSELEAHGKRPPPPRMTAARADQVRAVPAASPRAPAITASVAPAIPPSRFSVRRLR